MMTNKMPSARRKQFLLHARKPIFERKVRSAEGFIAEYFESARNPYIAFSCGKDSHVCLHLARTLRPEIPAVYFDADCAYPSQTELLDITPHLIKFQCVPFLETLKKWGLYHNQSPSPFMLTTVYDPIRKLLDSTNFDGVIYGLRAEESVARRVHASQRGAIFKYVDEKIHRGTWGCQPIYDWGYTDVWAYIVSREIAYCKEYDTLWDLPESEQRLSYWAGFTNRNFGRIARLKKNHPELFAKLLKVVPDARHFV